MCVYLSFSPFSENLMESCHCIRVMINYLRLYYLFYFLDHGIDLGLCEWVGVGVWVFGGIIQIRSFFFLFLPECKFLCVSIEILLAVNIDYWNEKVMPKLIGLTKIPEKRKKNEEKTTVCQKSFRTIGFYRSSRVGTKVTKMLALYERFLKCPFKWKCLRGTKNSRKRWGRTNSEKRIEGEKKEKEKESKQQDAKMKSNLIYKAQVAHGATNTSSEIVHKM